jgi:CRP-like cAMP-binding protein
MPELNLVEKVIALEGVELMNGLDPDQMAAIAAVATEVHYPPGRVIVEQSKAADGFYVVIEGSVDVTSGAELLETAGPNSVIGLWALFEEPNSVGAVTREDTHLLRITRDGFYDVLADNSEITATMLSTLVKRFRKLA